jgi:hypothetical protein
MEIVHDRDRLVLALRERGVDYLMSDAIQAEPLSDDVLIASLAEHEDARLRSALTALFLLRPVFAERVPALVQQLTPDGRIELRARYMAAVYLQRFWRTRLEIYNLSVPELPDLFSAELGLPTPDDMYGKPGLQALAAWHQQQHPVTYNRRVEYELVIEHIIASLKMQAQQRERAQQPGQPSDAKPPRSELASV